MCIVGFEELEASVNAAVVDESLLIFDVSRLLVAVV